MNVICGHGRFLMMPGRSTRTILCSPGPFTVIDITSFETVCPLRIDLSTKARSAYELAANECCAGIGISAHWD